MAYSLQYAMSEYARVPAVESAMNAEGLLTSFAAVTRCTAKEERVGRNPVPAMHARICRASVFSAVPDRTRTGECPPSSTLN